jgi:hypothetical protein
MFQIACTKKMIDWMGVKPEKEDETQPLIFRWATNVVTMDRRKVVVAVCESSRITVVLGNVKKKDLPPLPAILCEEIRRVLFSYGIREEAIGQYMPQDTPFRLARLSDRGAVARMNNAIQRVQLFGDLLDPFERAQPELNRRVNADFITAKHYADNIEGHYARPYELLFMDMARYGASPLFRGSAYNLTIALNLGDERPWRRMTVPASLTVEQFHEILQAAFGWANYHLYRFERYFQNGRTLLFLSDEEDSVYLEPSESYRLSADATMGELVGNGDEVKYFYDFGDGWEHDIHLNEEIHDYDKNYAVLISGEGDGPPEDVGGIGGYAEYRRVIGDERDPEHEFMKEWTKDQWWYKPFDMETVNKRIKHIIVDHAVDTSPSA